MKNITVKEFLKEEFSLKDNYIVRTIGILFVARVLTILLGDISWSEFFKVTAGLLSGLFVIKVLDYVKWVQNKFAELQKQSATNTAGN